uniref:Predicted DNA binding protein, CopG/RHH family n=1 Tax=Candidatus Kentrum sp. DK TaxID=2126562 RepID=A0A450SNP3_9GAMM|nr:MAG: Predicted DNA binding protein, CopG/RHH family [Candidatus Kentron sp. DK]
MKKNDMQFDREELQILQDFERGEFQRINEFEAEKRELETVARDAIRRDREVNIRVSFPDLRRLEMRAAREGLPFQT